MIRIKLQLLVAFTGLCLTGNAQFSWNFGSSAEGWVLSNKLTSFRTDNLYGENILRDQEIPAVYPISAFKNLYSYFGSSPRTNAPMDNPAVVYLSSGFWGRYNSVTEK